MNYTHQQLIDNAKAQVRELIAVANRVEEGVLQERDLLQERFALASACDMAIDAGVSKSDLPYFEKEWMCWDTQAV